MVPIFSFPNSFKNKNILVSALRDIFPPLSNHVFETEKDLTFMNLAALLSILNGLKLIEIPFNSLSVDIQGGIIMSCYIALYNIKNDNNSNEKNKETNYISNHNKNYNIKNGNTPPPNHGHTSTPNPVKVYDSIGLDILYLLSQIGCKWSNLNTEIINSNYLLLNSCDIMLVSETTLIKNSVFSNELFIRNERLLKYARTFVSTYADLNVNWDGLGEKNYAYMYMIYV
jgi:hypothetical protein